MLADISLYEKKQNIAKQVHICIQGYKSELIKTDEILFLKHIGTTEEEEGKKTKGCISQNPHVLYWSEKM